MIYLFPLQDPSPNDAMDTTAAAASTSRGVSPTASGSSSATPAVASGSGVLAPPQIGFSYPIEDYVHPAKSSSHDLKHSYSWETLLTEPDFCAAPVTAFKHAPMSDCWEYIVVGMKVEVENKDADNYTGLFATSYWVASVLRISGYNALLRYEGFGQDGSRDFWMSVASDKIHPVGWCATKEKPLIPPKGRERIFCLIDEGFACLLIICVSFLLQPSKESRTIGRISW